MTVCHALLCNAISKVVSQDNARDSLHALLYSLRKSIGADMAFVAIKDRKTDTLRIISQVELSETARREFSRGIGTGVIGRLFFETDCLTVTRNNDPAGYKEMLIAQPYAQAFFARIASAGRAFGMLAVYFPAGVEVSDEMREFLRAIANLCTLALDKERNAELLHGLRQVNAETGLFYYDYFQQLLRTEFDKSLRYQAPMALALVDIDNYKDVLREFGTAAGMQLCCAVIDELRRCTRGVDIIAHFGIDEFIISLPNTDRKGGEIVFRRFRDSVKKRKFTDHNVATSVSIGLTSRLPGVLFGDFLRNCQIALVEAKRAGKGNLRFHA